MAGDIWRASYSCEISPQAGGVGTVFFGGDRLFNPASMGYIKGMIGPVGKAGLM
jgi:hypothetical protein